MEYELLKQFDELLTQYYQLLHKPDGSNIDAIIKSIEKEKSDIKKSMLGVKKRDDRFNTCLIEKSQREIPELKIFFVDKFGKLIYGKLF